MGTSEHDLFGVLAASPTLSFLPAGLQINAERVCATRLVQIS